MKLKYYIFIPLLMASASVTAAEIKAPQVNGHQLTVRNTTTQDDIYAHILSCHGSVCSCEHHGCSFFLNGNYATFRTAPRRPFIIVFADVDGVKLASCGLREHGRAFFRASQACDVELAHNGDGYQCFNNCRY